MLLASFSSDAKIRSTDFHFVVLSITVSSSRLIFPNAVYLSGNDKNCILNDLLQKVSLPYSETDK